MSDANFVAPQSRMEGAVGRAFLALNSSLFLWAIYSRLRWGDAPDHSTAFVFLTGALFTQSLTNLVTSPRKRWGLLMAACVLLAVTLTMVIGRDRP